MKFILCNLAVALFLLPARGEPVDIGTRRELFVDDLLIGELDKTKLKLHEPHRLRNTPPRPFGHYATVLQDGGKLRLYYRGDKVPGAHWRNGWANYHAGEVTLYAESRDGGLRWTEPDLGIYEVPEMPKGNVTLDMSRDTFCVTHNFTPFIDKRPGVPENERYKGLGGIKYPARDWGAWTPADRDKVDQAYGPDGLKAFASADGVHWRLLHDQPVLSSKLGNFDSQNVSFWSEAENKYVCYFRWFDGGWRSIRRITSDDFITWSDPVAMEGREPKEHLYTNGTHPYFRAPHIYVALPTRFQASDGAITDIAFMATRPGSNRYHRHFKGAFIRPGLGKSGWGNRANYLTLNVVQSSPTEMKMFMYGGAQYVMRLDGFISVQGDFEEGEFVTKPLIFGGDELELNYSTAGAGRIRVEILDAESGLASKGFSLAECDSIRGDAISQTVTWKNNSDLSGLAGTPVKLRFVMNEADLFSLRFPERTARP